MKALTVTMVALSAVGVLSCLAGVWCAWVANGALDALMNPKGSPIASHQVPAMKTTCAAFADLLMWQGISVGALTTGWIIFAVEFRRLHRKALAESRTP
jgi:hypothetical protein